MNGSDTRPGFAMIEVVLSTVVVGFMATAALTLTSSVARERAIAIDRTRAKVLANTLLEEVLAAPIDAPDESGGGSITGLLSSLVSPPAPVSQSQPDTTPAEPDRNGLSTLLSYDGWSATPPVDASGDPIPGAAGLTRTVSVAEVDPRNLLGAPTPDTGVFLVRVEVLRGTASLASVTAVRTHAADEASR